MALVKPPVWRVRWKPMSRLSKWVNTLRATRRIAPCATDANTALRSSEKAAAPTRANPSATPPQARSVARTARQDEPTPLTSDDDRAGDDEDPVRCGRVHRNVERVNDVLEEERNLDVEHLRRSGLESAFYATATRAPSLRRPDPPCPQPAAPAPPAPSSWCSNHSSARCLVSTS